MILDIRKKAAFDQGHICGAVSFPFLHNPDVWQEQLRDLSHPDWDRFKSAFISLLKSDFANTVHVYCHAGTWRSRAFAAMAESMGIPVQIMPGGYRGYQKQRDALFDRIYPLLVLGGKTGTGKTALLEALDRHGEQVIHLEKLAGHKGSVFGRLDQPGRQITNEQFQNKLAETFERMDLQRRIWIEDEGKSLGRAGIPAALRKQMRTAPMFKLELPMQQRVDYILREYRMIEKKALANAVLKIGSRLEDKGSNVIAALRDHQMEQAVGLLLEYYDQSYDRQLRGRNIVRTLRADVEDLPSQLMSHRIDSVPESASCER